MIISLSLLFKTLLCLFFVIFRVGVCPLWLLFFLFSVHCYFESLFFNLHSLVFSQFLLLFRLPKKLSIAEVLHVYEYMSGLFGGVFQRFSCCRLSQCAHCVLESDLFHWGNRGAVGNAPVELLCSGFHRSRGCATRMEAIFMWGWSWGSIIAARSNTHNNHCASEFINHGSECKCTLLPKMLPI